MSEQEERGPDSSATLGELTASVLDHLTAGATSRRNTFEFAGFLVREDEDGTVYIADTEGTWVVPADSLISMSEWTNSAVAPEYIRSVGRPVRVTLRDSGAIYEIRPWRMISRDISAAEPVTAAFTLGAGDLPTTEATFVGEQRVAILERAYVRTLGWYPDEIPGGRQVVRPGKALRAVTQATDGGSTVYT